MQKAEAAREAGNALFKTGEFAKASETYDEALGLLKALEGTDDEAAAKAAMTKCRLNKATCLLKLQGYSAAGNEAREVLKVEADNAKAHFRLGQAAEKLGDYAAAQNSLTQAIKLQPSLKEPRELLEAVRARLKANPRLEGALQDMQLVEERGLRAINYADIKRARQQMELLLKDARAHKEGHWESRALLALALVCLDEGEDEGAYDYLNAARRKLTADDDRRAELYCMLTHAMINIDQGQLMAAEELLEGGILLAKTMGEKGLAARFAVNLAFVYTQRGDDVRSLEATEAAIDTARMRGDSHFEALALTLRATTLRRQRRFNECDAALTPVLKVAETLGYAHLLAAALRQRALLTLEWDGTVECKSVPGEKRILEGIKMLERCHAIGSVNGLKRAACDDLYNLHAAKLKHRVGARGDALDGLATADKEAKTLGYTSRRIEVLVARGLGFLRDPEGKPGWTTKPEDIEQAEALLESALKLVEPNSHAHAQVLTQRSLAHLLKAASSSDAKDEACAALRCAEQALCIGAFGAPIGAAFEAVSSSKDPEALVNLGVAMLTAERATADQPAADAAVAAAAARPAFEKAAMLAPNEPELMGRAMLGLAGACEALGDAAAAAKTLAGILGMMSAAGRLSEEATGHMARADAARESGDAASALTAYYEALETSGV